MISWTRSTREEQAVFAARARVSRKTPRALNFLICLLAGFGAPIATAAQEVSQQKPPDEASATVAVQPPVAEDDEAALDLAEPDYVIINVPTTLRLPRHKGNFRLNHRFAGNLRNGDFGSLAGNLFGIDQGAIIGFEYRVAVARHVQAAFYRSSFDRTIQLYAKVDALRQRGSMPVSVSALVSVEAANNFKRDYAPAVGAVISREFARRAAVYVNPVSVNNTARPWVPSSINTTRPKGRSRSTSRISAAPSTWGWAPGCASAQPCIWWARFRRVSAVRANTVEYGFVIEKRAGAHMFSLTFTNTFGTTFSQLARGGTSNSLYLGFNLARKFF